VAALLHRGGHRVTVCGRTPLAAVEVRPDDASGVTGPLILPGPVGTDPAAVAGPVDVVLLAVKDTQNAAAAPWLERLCDGDTLVCALQNGVEQVERVGRFCPAATVVPAAVWFSAETTAPAVVRLRTPARVVLPDNPVARQLAEVLRVDGLGIELDPDYLTETWRKLLTNAVAGLMVLTGRRSGMFGRADVAALARRYTAECLAVARAEGACLGDEVIEDIPAMFAGLATDMTTSMLTDRQAGRPLEWDTRNGVIARKARAHGLQAPISDVLVPLLAAASDGPG
jgi:2-dehydropantoate 2-reductase